MINDGLTDKEYISVLEFELKKLSKLKPNDDKQRLETIATACMSAMLSNSPVLGLIVKDAEDRNQEVEERISQNAIAYAEALIEELDKEE
jgi:hypothetical protein